MKNPETASIVGTFQHDIRYQRTRIDSPTNFEQDALYTHTIVSAPC